MSESNKISIEEIRDKINKSQKHWSKEVSTFTNKLKETKIEYIVDVQADAISQRQLTIDEISIYGVKVWKEKQKLKKMEKIKFQYYATKYPVKTNSSEKTKLIRSDLSDIEYLIDIYDEHVNFLREVASHFESINYAIKNKIQLESIIGGF